MANPSAEDGFVPNTISYSIRPDDAPVIEVDGETIHINAEIFYSLLSEMYPEGTVRDTGTMRALDSTAINELLIRTSDEEQLKPHTQQA